MLKTNALGSQQIAKISYNEEMNLISTIYLGKKRCKKMIKYFLKKVFHYGFLFILRVSIKGLVRYKQSKALLHRPPNIDKLNLCSL